MVNHHNLAWRSDRNARKAYRECSRINVHAVRRCATGGTITKQTLPLVSFGGDERRDDTSYCKQTVKNPPKVAELFSALEILMPDKICSTRSNEIHWRRPIQAVEFSMNEVCDNIREKKREEGNRKNINWRTMIITAIEVHEAAQRCSSAPFTSMWTQRFVQVFFIGGLPAHTKNNKPQNNKAKLTLLQLQR